MCNDWKCFVHAVIRLEPSYGASPPIDAKQAAESALEATNAAAGSSNRTTRRMPPDIQLLFTSRHNSGTLTTPVRKEIGEEFEKIYNVSRGFKFPLTHVDVYQLWKKLHEVSMQLSENCYLIDDVSGMIKLLEVFFNFNGKYGGNILEERKGVDPEQYRESHVEMVLVATPFTVERLQALSFLSFQDLKTENQREQWNAYKAFMQFFPNRKIIVIHTPMVTTYNYKFINGYSDEQSGKRVYHRYTTASEAVLNAEKHQSFTVPTEITEDHSFPRNMPYKVETINEKDVKIIGLFQKQGEPKKRVLLGKEKNVWTELTSNPTHTNAEFGDCIVVLLSALVRGSTYLARDTGVLNNLAIFSNCVQRVAYDENVQKYTVELRTPRNKFFRNPTPSGLEWQIVEKPSGKDLKQPELAQTLYVKKVFNRTNITLSPQEWEKFGIKNLRLGDFVVFEGTYFQPQAGQNDDCALDWLKLLVDLYTRQCVYDPDDFTNNLAVEYVTSMRYEIVEKVEVKTATKENPSELHEPLQIGSHSYKIYSTDTHFICPIVSPQYQCGVTSGRFFSIASFLASIGDESDRVELNQPGDIHDFVYQTSLLHYLTAQQEHIYAKEISNFNDPQCRVAMQVLEITSNHRITEPLTRLNVLPDLKIPKKGFSVGEEGYMDDNSSYNAWVQAMDAVAARHPWGKKRSRGESNSISASPYLRTISPLSRTSPRTRSRSDN